MRNYFDWISGGIGSLCVGQTTIDVMTGQTPPWWAQFGAAVLVCIGVIYLMIRYLAPKLDKIENQGVINTVVLEAISKRQERIVAALEKDRGCK